MRRIGNSQPELEIAARTRSRASRTRDVAEPDDPERRQTRADVDLDRDRASRHPVQGEGRDAASNT